MSRFGHPRVLRVFRFLWLCGFAVAVSSPARGQGEKSGDEDLHAKIDAAILKGRDALLPEIPPLVSSLRKDYPMGRIALPLAAVLKAGADSNNPIVTEAFRKLRTLPLRKTYCVACYLFALDALWRSENEMALGSGRVTVSHSKRAQGRLRQEIGKAVDWLVKARAERKGHWHYSALPAGAPKHDFSNTQFAVLGLQIGLKHGVPIPRAVFEEIAKQFLASQTLEKNVQKVRITRTTSLEQMIKKKQGANRGKTRVAGSGSTGQETAAVPHGGWGYTGGGRKAAPYASMTAAGASSLQVALNGLGRSNSRLKASVKRALFGAYGWIGKHMSSYIEGNRHHYYTLYSLEKVGDLGDIEKFEGHDWYSEGAQKLVGSQNTNGKWGSYVDTSLALLFLTRATRLQPMTQIILTGARDKKVSNRDNDSVYISGLGGFISARAMLGTLGRTRQNSFIKTGKEVVDNYAHGARGELVPTLLRLWTRKGDSVTRFARNALEKITGVKSPKQSEYTEWHAMYQKIQTLKKTETLASSEVGQLLSITENLVLKSMLIDLAHRKNMHDLTDALIKELAVTSPTYRRKVHGLLLLWTNHSISAPADNDEVGWERAVRRWNTWWPDNRERMVGRSKANDLIRRLEALTRSGLIIPGGMIDREATKLATELAGLGEAASAAIRIRIQRPEYSYYLVETLEQIAGKDVGLRIEE